MSAGAGIVVNAEVGALFNEMNLRKNRAWLVAKVSDDQSQIVLDQELDSPAISADSQDEAENRENFNRLADQLREDMPRYCIFDFRFSNAEGRKFQKLAFIPWCSDNAPVKKRMIHASANDTVKKAVGISDLVFQCTERAELNYDTLKEEIEKRKT